MPLIGYCLNNVNGDTRRLLLTANLPVREDCCLQRCGECYEGPFLLVDDLLVSGDSHVEILTRICFTHKFNQP